MSVSKFTCRTFRRVALCSCWFVASSFTHSHLLQKDREAHGCTHMEPTTDYMLLFNKFFWWIFIWRLTCPPDDIHSRRPRELKCGAAVSIQLLLQVIINCNCTCSWKRWIELKEPYLLLQGLQSCFHFLHHTFNICSDLKNKVLTCVSNMAPNIM